MKLKPGGRWAWLMPLGLTACMAVGSARAQAPGTNWDFAKLGDSAPNPRSESTVKGFAQKSRELNDLIVADDTARTLERDARRRSADSSPPAPSGGAAPARLEPAKAAARWACKLRCTDAGILNEKKGDWMNFEVSAGSKSEAQDRGREAAKRHCAVVRSEWGGMQCEKL